MQGKVAKLVFPQVLGILPGSGWECKRGKAFPISD